MAVIVALATKYATRIKQLHNEITTNSEAIQELESFTYHDRDEIDGWIEDGVRDIQYDVDEQASNIENLQSEKADEYELEKMQKAHAEDAENIGILINSNTKRLNNVIKYLSKSYSNSFKDIEDIKDDKEYNDFLKSFSDMSLWTDGRRSEHYKVLATLIDDGNYNTNHQSMGDEIYYKTYCELINKGDKDELGNQG